MRFDYFEVAEQVTMQDDQTYTGDGTANAYTTTHEWGHGIADIIQGALKAGLSIDNFWEDDHSDWQALPQMTADDKGASTDSLQHSQGFLLLHAPSN